MRDNKSLKKNDMIMNVQLPFFETILLTDGSTSQCKHALINGM